MEGGSGRVARRLRVALGLQRSGIRMMRQSLRRRHPEAPEAELEDMLRAWLRDRPGDAPGMASDRFSD